MINYRWDGAVQPSKWWRWNLCSRLQSEWVRHNWWLGWMGPTWEGGQVSQSQTDLFSSLYPRYDSEGKYLGSLPDLETPRNHHGCTSFLTDNGEKVFACCPIIFLLYFKQALLVAGGQNAGRSTEIFLPSRGRWVTTTTNLPRFSNHLNWTFLSLQLSS